MWPQINFSPIFSTVNSYWRALKGLKKGVITALTTLTKVPTNFTRYLVALLFYYGIYHSAQNSQINKKCNSMKPDSLPCSIVYWHRLGHSLGKIQCEKSYSCKGTQVWGFVVVLQKILKHFAGTFQHVYASLFLKNDNILQYIITISYKN